MRPRFPMPTIFDCRPSKKFEDAVVTQVSDLLSWIRDFSSALDAPQSCAVAFLQKHQA